MNAKKFIDVDKVIREKNPKLRKRLPGFVFRYLKRILHEDDINEFINSNSHKYGIDFAEAIIDFFQVNLVVEGLENLPPEGRYVVISNHPLGGLDGIGLINTVGHVRKDILFPVNDLLLHLDNLRDLFIPVNKHGSNKENIELFDQAFASEKAILYFPAGMCSRKQKGCILDLEWKKTIVTKARQHKRDIIPVHFTGRNRNFFYNLANWRKRFGIKGNIEMLYLTDEMFRQRGKDHLIRFGKPIPWATFNKDHKDAEWASKLKDYVYRLGNRETKEFNA
ncbi:MAG: 1-acyl-sn-glycerol-3-phosphate acyltransferase [Bacteroidetes bacterium]|nr:1-acyl-sn-glycerol-3-phosphate acyltransferase [Bacteroidota bacterium]